MGVLSTDNLIGDKFFFCNYIHTFSGRRILESIPKCCGTDTRVLAVTAPEAAVAGTLKLGKYCSVRGQINIMSQVIDDIAYPIPGNVKSPHSKSPSSGVLCPGSVLFPASTRGLAKII